MIELSKTELCFRCHIPAAVNAIWRNQEKDCFADIRGFYVGLGGQNNNVNITYVLEYIPE